jgi:hypothetical protein
MKLTPIASITDQTHTEQNSAVPLAAIFPSVLGNKNSFSDLSENSMTSVSAMYPLKCDHLTWNCITDGGTAGLSVKTTTLIDSGAHMMFIRPDLVKELELHTFCLNEPELVSIAIDAQGPALLTHYAQVTCTSPDNNFCSKVLNTVIAPKLCMPIILGLLFLCNHNIVCNYAE